MFTLPQNTIAYLLKEPIDMRYGRFLLQGVIAQLLQQRPLLSWQSLQRCCRSRSAGK